MYEFDIEFLAAFGNECIEPMETGTGVNVEGKDDEQVSKRPRSFRPALLHKPARARHDPSPRRTHATAATGTVCARPI